jgi:hypothetical protein
MRRTYAAVGVLAAIAVALGVWTAAAQDKEYRTICGKTRAECLAICPDAEDPQQCRGNCEAVYQGCLNTCADSRLDDDALGRPRSPKT